MEKQQEDRHEIKNALAILVLVSEQLVKITQKAKDSNTSPDLDKLLELSLKIDRSAQRIKQGLK